MKVGGPKAPTGSGGGGGGFDWRVLLSGLSSALPVIAQSRASQQAQDDLAQGNAEIARMQQEADARIGSDIAALQASTPIEEETLALKQYANAIQRNRAQAPAAGPNLGGQAAQADRAAASQQEQKYGRQQAKFAAGVDAPMRQREGEAQRANRTAGDVNDIRRQTGTAQFLARLRAARRQANPWAELLAKVGGNIANNYTTQAEQEALAMAGADPYQIGKKDVGGGLDDAKAGGLQAFDLGAIRQLYRKR